jgi:HEAT repeat protein
LRAATLATWVAVAALAGCRSKPEPCVVTGVSVDEGLGLARLEATGLTREDLRRAGLAALGRTAGFQVPASEPRAGARRCRGSVALLDARVVPGATGPHAEILLRMEVAAGEGEAFGDTVRVTDPLRPGEPLAAAFRRAIDEGTGRAASALALALAEEAKPEAELLRDLESGDPRLRDLAVRVLADRRSPAAVPALLARLQDPDPDVASRAVGALALIGDPRAVPPLIELCRRREGPFVGQIVRAIGDIGGAEAEAYLETMAAGHADPDVAAAARDGLRDSRRRRATGPPR